MPASIEDGHEDGAPRYWLLVAVLLAVYCYAFIDRVILALLVDPIKHDLGATDVHMGLLLGLGVAVFYGICIFPAGYFVDRLNRRAMIGGASVVWALMTVVCGTANSIEQLFVGRAGIGIAESVIMPAAFSLIRDAVPLRSRGLAFSVYAKAPILGSTSSLLGGGWLLRAATAGRFADWPLLGTMMPWQVTMVLVGLLGLPISMLLLLLIREPARSIPAADAAPPEKGYGVVLRHMGSHLGVYVPLVLFVTFGAMLGLVGASLAPSLPLALAATAAATFFLGTSWPVGASTLGQVTPSRLMGRMTSIYFLFQTMFGQALAPFLVAFGSQRVFSGATALATSMAVNCTLFCIGCMVSAIILRGALRRRATM